MQEGFHAINKRFDAVMSTNRNRLATRAFHSIWALPTAQGIIPPFFPKTVAMFWRLREPINSWKLASLLQSYDYNDYEVWEDYDEYGEQIAPPSVPQLKTYPGDQSPLEYYVGRFPEEAHSTLGNILGLEYGVIRLEMKKLEEYKAGTAHLVGGSKRDKGSDEASSGRWMKMAKTVSDESSLTEEIHRGPVETYKQTQLSSFPDESSSDTDDFWAPKF